jgi:hypothetical protein
VEEIGEYDGIRLSNADVAQLVEQRTRNAQVAGSIPAIGSVGFNVVLNVGIVL